MPTERSAPEPAPKVAARSGLEPLYLILFVVLAIGLDAFRIDFFADDLHFLDMAGRVPLLRLLSGANVLWPWYRPISRELYFWIVAHCGAWALAVAHTLGLLVFSAVLLLIWRIGTRLLPPRVVAVAIGVFTVSDISRFILASPSCFQDLFAVFWILVALDAHMTAHPRRAAIAAFLAPLAKETGFLVYPLLLALDVIVLPRRSPLRRWGPYAIAALVAAAIHVAVRLTWPAADHGSTAMLPGGQLGRVATGVVENFVSPPPAQWPGAWAIVRAIASVGLLYLLAKSSQESSFEARPGAVNRFLLVGAVLGILPVIVAYELRLTKVHAYQLFPAAAWICLLLALLIERGRRFGSMGVIAALMVWNLFATSYVPPDMTRRELGDRADGVEVGGSALGRDPFARRGSSA